MPRTRQLSQYNRIMDDTNSVIRVIGVLKDSHKMHCSRLFSLLTFLLKSLNTGRTIKY